MLFFELVSEVVDDAHVKVFTAEEGVAVGRFYFEQTIVDFEDGYVKCTAAKVIDSDGFGFIFVQTVGECRSGRFVDDTQNFEASDFASVFGCLTLSVVKVCRNGDNRLGHVFAEVGFSGFFHLLQNESRNLARRVFLATDLNPCVAVAAVYNCVGDELLVFFDFSVGCATTDKTLNSEYGVVRVGDGLAFCRLTNKALVFGETDDRRSGACAFSVFDDARFGTIKDGYAGVRGTKVNTNDFSHFSNPSS